MDMDGLWWNAEWSEWMALLANGEVCSKRSILLGKYSQGARFPNGALDPLEMGRHIATASLLSTPQERLPMLEPILPTDEQIREFTSMDI